MRNLTLGILIVVGGTVAALPFRRAPGTPENSREPLHATGPIESVLDDARSPKLPTEHWASENLAMQDGELNQRHDIRRDVAQLLASSPKPPTTSSRPRPLSKHSLSPLTFEDLIEPIERPTSVKERLGAVAEVRSEGSSSARAKEFVVVDHDSDPRRFEALSPRVERTQERVRHRASGSLASVSRREMIPRERDPADSATLTFVERLPKPEATASPERHWIQQP